MTAIFKACDSLRLRQKNQSSSLFIMPCLLRLLYATGIRIGEALVLRNEEVNLTGKYLTLRETKNGKQRIVPFTESLAIVFREYLERRSELPIIGISRNESPFFVSLNGTCCRYGSVYSWFRKILARAGIPYTGDRKGPRVHDLRHSFACHSFVKLSDEGMDLYCSWPYLATYLGHQSLESTEQYVRLTTQLYPELMKGSDELYVDILPDINDNQREQL
jgi:integrase/recombinase XerD